MTRLTKLLLLLRLSFEKPSELLDRLSIAFVSRLPRSFDPSAHYSPEPLETVLSEVAALARTDVGEALREADFAAIEGEIARAVAGIGDDGPFRATQSSDVVLARLCYLACLALRPSIVVETGVAYGVTSAYILAALERNRHGRLYSIDLPQVAPDADRFVGVVIPDRLRSRWTLHRGTSRRLLPKLLADLATVDVFVHDSLHTEANMRFELETVRPRLSRPAVLLSDDIEGNRAFRDFAQKAKPAIVRVVSQSTKAGLVGVCVFR